MLSIDRNPNFSPVQWTCGFIVYIPAICEARFQVVYSSDDLNQEQPARYLYKSCKNVRLLKLQHSKQVAIVKSLQLYLILLCFDLSLSQPSFPLYSNIRLMMQLSTVTLIMTSLMANGLMANPFALVEENKLLELSVEQRKGGSIVQYGESDRSIAPRADCGGWFQLECPKSCKVTNINTPECDSKNGGINTVCDNLVNDLYGNRDTALQEKAQQICWKNEDGNTGCCIKWTKAVPGITKGDLIERADKSK